MLICLCIDVAALAWLVIPHGNLGLFEANFVYSSWRVYLALCILPSLTSALMFVLMPESPRYLMQVGGWMSWEDCLECIIGMYHGVSCRRDMIHIHTHANTWNQDTLSFTYIIRCLLQPHPKASFWYTKRHHAGMPKGIKLVCPNISWSYTSVPHSGMPKGIMLLSPNAEQSSLYGKDGWIISPSQFSLFLQHILQETLSDFNSSINGRPISVTELTIKWILNHLLLRLNCCSYSVAFQKGQELLALKVFQRMYQGNKPRHSSFHVSIHDVCLYVIASVSIRAEVTTQAHYVISKSNCL